MGKMQRTKGKTGELEVVNLLKKAGIKAKRISQMETNGEDKGDIVLYRDGITDTGQVKRGEHVPKFIYDALKDADYLFCRRDREEWLVTMTLDQFIYYVATHITKESEKV